MIRHHRTAGFTLIEVAIALAIMTSVLGGAMALLHTSTGLSQSIDNERISAMRVDRALVSIADEFRKGSLATAEHTDGSQFADGDTDSSFQISPVTGWDGSLQTGAPVSYTFDLATGATDGELVKSDGTIETLLARGITNFTVTRNGNLFVFTITARSGPTDDRERTATGELSVMARNP